MIFLFVYFLILGFSIIYYFNRDHVSMPLNTTSLCFATVLEAERYRNIKFVVFKVASILILTWMLCYWVKHWNRFVFGKQQMNPQTI